MNVSELSRQLKITTEELFDKLPQLGFDIGRKAIKVDDKIANKIIEAWKQKSKADREQKKIAEIRGDSIVEEIEDKEKQIIEVDIPSAITVREFANLLNLPVNQVLTELMKNGVLTSMNERIDFDTAMIVGEELGFKITEDKNIKEDENISKGQKKLKEVLDNQGSNSQSRSPVVVVMGHVDHGKTKILDALRKTDVVAGESGGITQHIGAYQICKNEKMITFIDTPGHEAFTAMRSRGARVADIAILVVAADDGVRPQTKEAIKIIQDAKLPFVVAINKIDKPDASIDKVKKDLSALNLLPEDWGGKVITVPVSAINGTGIDELLETLLLVSDMEAENIKADPDGLAIGTVIESHVDKGEGPVATILVQFGTLRVGDILAMGDIYYGKIKGLKDYKGMSIERATPGMPVKILGLKISPEVGSILEVSSDPKKLIKNIKQQKSQTQKDSSIQNHFKESDNIQFINLIIKADVLGSLGAIIESLAKLDTKEIKVRVISKGLGIITEADVLKAEATGASIIGFHVKPASNVSELARDKNVDIKFYEVIYHLIEEINKERESMKTEEVKKKIVGKLEVLKIFRRESNNMIIGGRVIEGGLCACDMVIVARKGDPISTGKVTRLECSRQVAEKVSSGQECGITFEGKGIIEEGDILEFYQEFKSK